ncbi:uncharacterized protein LOC121726976 [Aricia agestis]|uniref:uncharacterized protein LOC121726976 n=1 Tax=Aricia agestis TaxID=91739 RepID=UPI001C20213B|nr:uncharacterized protein LOC121726976 [Aricia agestis]
MWKRPESVPLGRVWMRFRGKENPGKPARMYQIRDLEEQYKEACLDMMQHTFINDEPTSQVLGVKDDLVSMAEIRANWENILRQKVSLAVFEERDGEPADLVAFNMVIVKSKQDPDDNIEFKGVAWLKLLKMFSVVEGMVDVFAHYGVDRYVTSSGMTVLPAHRGQNIGARLLEARYELCKAFNIRVAATIFTATTSQALARKVNYEVLATLDYADMKQHGVDLTGCTTPCALYMGIKYDIDNT